MQKKHKRRLKMTALLLICMILAGPVNTIGAYANMDPDIVARAKEAEAAAEAAAGTENEKHEDEDTGDEEDEVSVAEEVTKSNPQDKYQNQIDDINQKLKNLDQENKELQASLDETKDQKQKEVSTRDSLGYQINITKSEIELLEESITLQEGHIAQTEEDILLKQGEIDENYELFKIRLRALYVTDDSTTLGLLFGADDFADFLSRTEMLTSIAEHDRELMQMLTGQRTELELAKADLEETLAQLEETRLEAEEKKQKLSVQINAAEATIYSLDQLEREFLADLEANKKAAAQMQSNLEEIYRQIEWDKNPYVGGIMAWPLPNYTQITSNYGWRWNKSDYHTGVDISGGGVYGKNIVAANSGTVVFINWTYTPGRDYGIYVLVDHGGGMSTLYAHCSTLLVSVGDHVEKGQPIAQVGSTGWSTGPHLHFEVRVDGEHTNPLPYIT